MLNHLDEIGRLVGWLVGFLRISAFVDYLKSNPVFIYMICKRIVSNFVLKQDPFFAHS